MLSKHRAVALHLSFTTTNSCQTQLNSLPEREEELEIERERSRNTERQTERQTDLTFDIAFVSVQKNLQKSQRHREQAY